MVEDLKKTCVQCVLAVAWSDDDLNKVERDFLVGLIERAGFSGDARASRGICLVDRVDQCCWNDGVLSRGALGVARE